MTPRLAAKLIRTLALALIIFILFFLLDLFFPFTPTVEFSKTVYDRNGTLLSAFLNSQDKWRMRVRLSEISPDLIKAVINKEDKWFYYHPGVNPVAVVRAVWQNFSSGERVSGASTITMQLCRMLRPANRNYFNKIIEIFHAAQLELHYSKTEILELYLSLLPYGSNIEGVKSASYIYFKKPPGKLSLAQSILLAVIPNNPNLLRPDRKEGNAVNFRNRWIRNYLEAGVFRKLDLEIAAEENEQIRRSSVPLLAPHFSLEMIKQSKNDLICTSLDLKAQTMVEQILMNYAKKLFANGIKNCATLIMDNKSHEIIAYCGSADFNDVQAEGQVNGVNALRSPGSTLKPVLYAMAFDAGLITPGKKLMDVPVEIGGYEPENFDREYHGFISSAEALKKSLNVPAVRLLQQVELSNFTELLSKAGMNDIRKNKSKLGLSVILGGCSVTLKELTSLFSAFACGGKKYELKSLLGNQSSEQKPVKIFSAASAYLIAEILSGSDQSDYGLTNINVSDKVKYSWKTGTSFGKKDAWAVGFNPKYTVGVWAGNFDGSGASNLIGIHIAVPILNAIFEGLAQKKADDWFVQPKEIKIRPVCKESGDITNGFCDTVYDYYIDGISNNSRCEIEKPIYTNGSNVQYCKECVPDSGFTETTFKIYPPELLNWYLKSGRKTVLPPKHNPLCVAFNRSEKMEILSPSQSFEYLIEDPEKQEIPLECAASPGISQIYWFVDGVLQGSAKPAEKMFWKPKPGVHRITCLSDGGTTTTVEVRIKNF